MTPLYTHIDSQGNKRGIFVDRGWIDERYRFSKLHYGDAPHNQKVEVIGIVRDSEYTEKEAMTNDFKENRILIIDINEFEAAKGLKLHSDDKQKLRS